MKHTDDRKISSLIKSTAPMPGEHQWFKQKILNRLPPKRRRSLSAIEVAAYILGAVATIVFMVVHGVEIIDNGVITVGDIISYLCAVGMLAGIGISVLSARVQADA